METVKERIHVPGVSQACPSLGIARASFHRFRQPKPSALSLSQRLKPERSLSEAERRKVADEFHSQRFRDLSPAEIYATLLDEDVYLCSIANPVPYPEG